MEAIELVSKIFGIQDEHRNELVDVLPNTAPDHLGLALANLAQHPDDEDFNPEIDTWMKAYLPEVAVG